MPPALDTDRGDHQSRANPTVVQKEDATVGSRHARQGLSHAAGDSWEPGEWNLGRWYKPIGWIAVVWVGFISVLFILPTVPTGIPFKHGLTWLSVNNAIIAVAGTLLLVGGWWMLSARKWFKGPIVQGSEEELARIEAQYEPGRTPAPAA